jgi:hypothetical protein
LFDPHMIAAHTICGEATGLLQGLSTTEQLSGIPL